MTQSCAERQRFAKIFRSGEGLALFFHGASKRKDIIAGKTEAEIRASWREGLEKFKAMRVGYLIYGGGNLK